MLLSKRSGFACNVAYLYCSHLAPQGIIGEFSYIVAVPYIDVCPVAELVHCKDSVVVLYGVFSNCEPVEIIISKICKRSPEQ